MVSTIAMAFTSFISVFRTLGDETVSVGDKLISIFSSIGFMLPMIIGLFSEQNKTLFRTMAAGLAAAGGQTAARQAAEAGGVAALQATAIWKGLGKTLGKFAIYAVAIGAVVLAVTTLAKAADNARNSAENFAASAT